MTIGGCWRAFIESGNEEGGGTDGDDGDDGVEGVGSDAESGGGIAGWWRDGGLLLLGDDFAGVGGGLVFWGGVGLGGGVVVGWGGIEDNPAVAGEFDFSPGVGVFGAEDKHVLGGIESATRPAVGDSAGYTECAAEHGGSGGEVFAVAAFFVVEEVFKRAGAGGVLCGE